VTPRPTHATTAGHIYLDLQNLARRTRRPTEELHQLYILECFLARLADSPQADRLVLKGGVLLAAYQMRRPTRDVDLRADRIAATPEAVLGAVQAIAARPQEDGVAFDTPGARAEVIRDEDDYSGVRVTMNAELATARLVFHVDVNVGDPVAPHPEFVDVPRLRGGILRLLGYPLSMVYAEKIITMLERGEANTRWRDYADVHLLSGWHSISGRELATSMMAVANHRNAKLEPLLPELLHGYPALAQGKWAAWVRKQRLGDRLPGSFEQVLSSVSEFADPALTGEAADLDWNPVDRRWEPLSSSQRIPDDHR
jgi:hypothetical protein